MAASESDFLQEFNRRCYNRAVTELRANNSLDEQKAKEVAAELGIEVENAD